MGRDVLCFASIRTHLVLNSIIIIILIIIHCVYVLRRKQCRTNYARRLAKTLNKCFDKQSELEDIRVMVADCDALAHFNSEDRKKFHHRSKALSELMLLLTSKCPAFPVVVDGMENDPEYVRRSDDEEDGEDEDAAEDPYASVQRYPAGMRPVKTIHHQPWVSPFVKELIEYLHDRRTGEDCEHTHRIDKDVETNTDGYIELDKSHISTKEDPDKPLQEWMVKDDSQ